MSGQLLQGWGISHCVQKMLRVWLDWGAGAEDFMISSCHKMADSTGSPARVGQSDVLEIWFCCHLGQLSSLFLSFVICEMGIFEVLPSQGSDQS